MNGAAIAALTFVGFALAGCSGLPDQRLANEALLRGDLATAQQHYEQLSQLGYAEAQTARGDMQVKSRDPQQLQEAEALYREAALSSVRAQSRLGRLLARQGNVSDERLKEAEGLLQHAVSKGEYSAVVPLTMLYVTYPQLSPTVDPQQLVNGWREQAIPEAELAQIVIYRSNGTYAAHAQEIELSCRALLAVQDVCYVELASVYRLRQQHDEQEALLAELHVAYRVHRVSPQRVESVAQALTSPLLAAPVELSSAHQLLTEVAPIYPPAATSLAKLLIDYPQLGSQEQVLEYLAEGRRVGDSRAELLTGRLYFQGQGVPQDPRQAEEHLLKAAAEQPGADYYLGQLYRRGYLGKVEPQRAVDHLLRAARSGQAGADFALAQMFSEARGVKVNRVNAYVFAEVARQQGVPEAGALQQSLQAALSDSERLQAQALLREELQARQFDPERVARLQIPETTQDDIL
ncbi:sel1 repeat family protein [Pseudomonas sp. UL073]|uniref:Sel1 repeat family protein n=1 Tax=Zestomonas insulae TaxID=2809017 RepID=A0ABS2IAW8_9GAMM|nr:SEL1-like repeat protein [Pseudomonas insulae]MBM7059429.1 sel1 repeat family protein [Pseudomonas insulae]